MKREDEGGKREDEGGKLRKRFGSLKIKGHKQTGSR